MQPPGKVADKPHRLTLMLSTAAVIVSLGSASLSYLSLQETRENRRITEQSSRAYVRIVSLLLDTPALFSEGNSADEFVRGSITLTNTGRVAAQDVKVLLDVNPPRAENLYEIARFDEVAPAASVTTATRFRQARNRAFTASGETHEYSLSLTVEYDAGIGQGRKNDQVYFCVPPPSKTAKGLAVLTPCDTHFRAETFK